MAHTPTQTRALNSEQIRAALPVAVKKLNPRELVRNPVMFLVGIGSVFSLILACFEPSVFAFSIVAWLFLTVLFANFAEAVAEARGRAQADSLRQARVSTSAHRKAADGTVEEVAATELSPGDVVVVAAGQTIPGDGDVVAGIATVDESAVTGESAPVIRESGGDRCAVTGGTTVLSDQIEVRITSKPGETFIDKMIGLVEGAARQKTPNEIALTVFLSVLTIIFLLVVLTLQPMAVYSGAEQSILVLTALLVCLIPTTIGALLSAIGIAGMDRLVKRNVLALSGRSVEAAGDVSTLLLDKTGTITVGDRQATDIIPVGGTSKDALGRAAQLASLADETPEGRSIVTLATDTLGQEAVPEAEYAQAVFVPFSASTRMSGIELSDSHRILKGAATEVLHKAEEAGIDPAVIDEARQRAEEVSRGGGTALLVIEHRAQEARLLGVVVLTDVIKPGIKERFARLREMGIRTVMITGDNALTAKAIAAEAGVDDYLAEATPEDKLELIRTEQSGGSMVAMTGDGTNDAPALAQADVGVAMNTGTQAAKEAGNMVDLDSDPTKLIDIVAIGKQLLITRGALTTFSIANDVAKYFAIIPAMFMTAVPALGALNIMRLSTPESAILSAVIFNALVIVALIPLALKGVSYTPAGASTLLARNLFWFGFIGLVVPFIGIKLIDLVISTIPGIG